MADQLGPSSYAREVQGPSSQAQGNVAGGLATQGNQGDGAPGLTAGAPGGEFAKQAAIDGEMFNSLFKFAEKLAEPTVKRKQQEQFVAGMSRVARGETIDQIKKEQPWLSKFVGDTFVTEGARAYEGATRAAKFQIEMERDMENLKKKSPEEFNQIMVERNEKNMTGDAGTNMAIGQGFLQNAPGLMQTHQRKRTAWEQEEYGKAWADHFNTVEDQNDVIQEKIAAGEIDPIEGRKMQTANIRQALLKPENMSDETYSENLALTLGASAQHGRPATIDAMKEFVPIMDPKDQFAYDTAKTVADENRKNRWIADPANQIRYAKYQSDIEIALKHGGTPAAVETAIAAQKQFELETGSTAQLFNIAEIAKTGTVQAHNLTEQEIMQRNSTNLNSAFNTNKYALQLQHSMQIEKLMFTEDPDPSKTPAQREEEKNKKLAELRAAQLDEARELFLDKKDFDPETWSNDVMRGPKAIQDKIDAENNRQGADSSKQEASDKRVENVEISFSLVANQDEAESQPKGDFIHPDTTTEEVNRGLKAALQKVSNDPKKVANILVNAGRSLSHPIVSDDYKNALSAEMIPDQWDLNTMHNRIEIIKAIRANKSGYGAGVLSRYTNKDTLSFYNAVETQIMNNPGLTNAEIRQKYDMIRENMGMPAPVAYSPATEEKIAASGDFITHELSAPGTIEAATGGFITLLGKTAPTVNTDGAGFRSAKTYHTRAVERIRGENVDGKATESDIQKGAFVLTNQRFDFGGQGDKAYRIPIDMGEGGRGGTRPSDVLRKARTPVDPQKINQVFDDFIHETDEEVDPNRTTITAQRERSSGKTVYVVDIFNLNGVQIGSPILSEDEMLRRYRLTLDTQRR